MNNQNKLEIVNVPISDLKMSEHNARKWSGKALRDLEKSLTTHGVVDPAIINGALNRKNIVIGGHMRIHVLKKMGAAEMPCIILNIPDLEKEKALNIQLNKAQGDWDYELLAKFDEAFLSEVGFSSEELDEVFPAEENPEIFDLEKELKKLDIQQVSIQKGDIFEIDGSKLMCGDSTIEEDMLKLMCSERADMCLTDPPYILDYLKSGKRHGKPTEGFGYKKDRKYLETDVLPDNFTELWLAIINKIQKPNFNIIIYENWKNLRTIWNEMEKYYKVKNMIVWHLPNRNQGFAGKYKFFSKHDIAMVGTSDSGLEFNNEPEAGNLQNEYLTALYAIAGKPTWEGYEKGKKIQPTDFIEFNASDAKHSGQNIIFGTKPLEILIPYIKVLTKRNDLVVEPFGGSGSTLIASVKMNRRCYIMEKCPTYAEVIKKRWENFTGKKARKVN